MAELTLAKDMIVRAHDPRSHCGAVRPALVVRVAKGVARLRFERMPTKAELARGDFDRWVTQSLAVPVDRIVEVVEGRAS